MKPFDSIKALAAAFLLTASISQGSPAFQAIDLTSAAANIQASNSGDTLDLVAPGTSGSKIVMAHRSHASHASHASHSSHRSHFSSSF